ncbi:OmpA family protein [Azospirillum sp.]|uniref:OmpA family protein n=1 Tax=Azospirillum sp. TaxID=34012 RepID=UPI002D38C3A8|nr:OmpA family protein [Azospirillum sp.]HYD66055.1 OmpA family protein [Azospirillum sp.]
MPKRTVTVTRLALPAIALLCALPALAQTVEGKGDGKVMMFDRPPTVEELRDVVTPEPQRRTRSIEIIGGAANSAAQRPRQTERTNYGGVPQAAQPQQQYQQPEYQQPAYQPAPEPQYQPAPEPAAAAVPQAPRPKASRPAPQQAAVPAAPAAEPAQQEDAGANAFGFRINFAFNSAEVPREFYPYIDAVGGLMKEDGSLSLVIEGHTDAVGGDGYNRALSERRAVSVGEYLVRVHGVQPQRITVAGRGESQPISADPNDGRNRRVEFKPAR